MDAAFGSVACFVRMDSDAEIHICVVEHDCSCGVGNVNVLNRSGHNDGCPVGFQIVTQEKTDRKVDLVFKDSGFDALTSSGYFFLHGT